MKLRQRTTVYGIITGVVLALGIAAHAKETEEFHKSYPLKPNGTFTLSNVNGNVHITGSDANEVKVDAIKTADDAEYLKELRIEVSATDTAVDVRTKYPEGNWQHKNHGGGVEYTITLPRTATIRKIDLVNGKVEIAGVSGGISANSVNGTVRVADAASDLHIDCVNGKAEAKLAKLGNTVKISTVNGAVELTLPSDAEMDVSASTVSGGISNDFGMHVNRPKYGPGSSLHAKLGNGGSRVKIDTVNGGIHIARASDGKQTKQITQARSRDDDDDDMD